MKGLNLWNRRDFIAKPMAWAAASQLLGGFKGLFAQSAVIGPAAPVAAASAKPIHRTLGKTGISLPIISMGVMNADIPGLIPRSYELGIRHFDTAALYQQGRNELMVGSGIKQMGLRDKVIISTKIRRPGRGGPNSPAQQQAFTPAEVKAYFLGVFDSSIQRLQMDYVDILYNHSCDTEVEINSEGALQALTELKKAGKARFIGVSSHQPELALKQAMKLGVYDVVLIQFNHTMADDEGLAKTIDEAAKSGIGIIAMKTMAGGFRHSDSNATKLAPTASQESQPPPSRPPLPVPSNPTARLKWVLRHESITTVISGYTNYEHMEQNFTVASNLAYTPEEQEFLSDKKNVAEAQFCRQCGQCRPDCPSGVDIPQLMRSHMYEVQYRDRALAAQTMAAIADGAGLGACIGCESCKASCRHSVNIARKIQQMKEIASMSLRA